MGSGFYIGHYGNDRTTPEFQDILLDGGAEFYGIMWMFFEQLMEAPDHVLSATQVRGIASQCHVAPERLTAFLDSGAKCGLLEINDQEISSPCLNERIVASEDLMPHKKRKAALRLPDKMRESGRYEYSQDYEDFWKAYPRHEGKVLGYEQYMINLRSGFTPEQMLTAARNYAKTTPSMEVRFIMMPSTFLGHSQRWQDYEKGSDVFNRQSVAESRKAEEKKIICPVCHAEQTNHYLSTCTTCGFDLSKSNDPHEIEEMKKSIEDRKNGKVPNLANFVKNIKVDSDEEKQYSPNQLQDMLDQRIGSKKFVLYTGETHAKEA